MVTIDSCSDIRAYFHERLQEAFECQRTSASRETEIYLINLLAQSSAATSAESIDCPLVTLLQRAQAADGVERLHRFRELGDTALMVYGFFSDLIPKRGVDERYVRAMGGTGYASASNLIRFVGRHPRAGSAHVYGELAERFDELGAVVAYVREQTSCSERDVVAIYDRWVKTRSPRLARRLARVGLFPEARTKPGRKN